ncbi:2-octaprenyl-3-methyl-6-methoxy-1,4-benzoquinol hydroxylase [Morganella psychrotolerans]|uniref:2-octaprenyl-3-methyl-6-methoxy-1,4-benzoquinol hydroxylase n=1 Tax=Morganella psychrotolerans TaxID=368603 RepID=A0A5M9R872_9GAMM|nr:3-demethoxyubiquinol 3-hydroxylase [Morganella psychrotolerans]KAA8716392.1 2-octaprenyl-3-methyl-6-methoxy-1,4-benzoquinol hydroxylase [Morganella psychrotolerans]OBU02374.1 2-octaprenyl-3-methyl-6-methoxy-1,4-benzoquinol hydroxylase [Morganella psychrotolerans]
MDNPITHSEVTVVGGGMIGAACALGLAEAGFRVTVAEQQAPAPFDAQARPDVRISAVSRASVELLASLGVWDAVRAMRCVPYRALETYETPGSEVTFTAESLGLPELGYMVENRILQLALWEKVTAHERITCLCPAQLQTMTKQAGEWLLTFDSGEQISSRLVIGADGARSQVRTLTGIGSCGWQYRQSCMLISVDTHRAQQDLTWQQFFPSGPRAFLPLFDSYASLVWYDSPARIRQLSKLPMAQLQDEIRTVFPARLGEVTPLAAGSFPLVRHHAAHYVQDGVALIGDAAHTINPLAGQGVNLGYRDVDALLDVLINARACCEDWSSTEVLKRYEHRRRPDNLLMQAGMDAFYLAFSNTLPGLQPLRNLALTVAQRATPLKKLALKYALGV